MKKVAKIKVGHNLKESILKAVNLIGGFERFINQGEVVLIKPNFNTADPYPASSDPQFLLAISDLIYQAGAKIVMIGDSSTMSLNTRKVMEQLGVFALEKTETPPRIYVFEERKWIKKTITGARYLKGVSLSEFLDRTDKLILVPNLKTHNYAGFSGSLKLSVGFVKPIQRVGLHLGHLQEKVAELNKVINPAIVIMDARKCFINGGPAEGEVREPNLVLAGDDRVAVDVEAIKIIQGFPGNSLKDLNPWQLPQIKRAGEFLVGVKDQSQYQLFEK